MQQILIALLASTGLWALISKIIDICSARKKDLPEQVEQLEQQVQLISDMVRGLAYDRICHVGQAYLEKGEISFEERENFRRYLFGPYHAAGGDGTADAIMQQVDRLPLAAGEEKAAEPA